MSELLERYMDQRTKLLEMLMVNRQLKYLRKKFEKLYLAYSGGTDSTLLLLIIIQQKIKIDGITFENTRLEYPETIKTVHKTIEILGLQELYTEIFPKKTAHELAKMIIEDFDKIVTCPSKRYDKSDYRCCYHAKEKPVVDWLKENDLEHESTCVLRGIKYCDSSGRFLAGLSIIEAGHFYFHDYKHGKHSKVADPLKLVSEPRKKRWLEDLVKRYKVPMPDKSGCMICPIYIRLARGEQRKDPRFQIAVRFFDKMSKNRLPFYSKTVEEKR